MGKIYEKGSTDDYNRLEKIMSQHHRELAEFEVRVSITIVKKHNKDDELVPALKFVGGHAAAVVKRVPLKRRVYVPYDAEIEIDGLVWDDSPDETKDAILDHELTHIRLGLDKEGQVKTEDDGRPALKLVPDDWVLTGFYAIAQRYRDSALELASLNRVQQTVAEELKALLKVEETEA